MESNDSPEIPDRGETSDIPDLPSGGLRQTKRINLKPKKQVVGFRIFFNRSVYYRPKSHFPLIIDLRTRTKKKNKMFRIVKVISYSFSIKTNI